jgi:hypothetical protein
MSRPLLATVLMLLAVLLFALIGWMLFMASLNSQVSIITFHVSGTVDKVEIYDESKIANPVDVIVTNGKNTIHKVILQKAEDRSLFRESAPAHYFFITLAEEQQYQSPVFCCQMGMKPEELILKINSLNNWEIGPE